MGIKDNLLNVSESGAHSLLINYRDDHLVIQLIILDALFASELLEILEHLYATNGRVYS